MTTKKHVIVLTKPEIQSNFNRQKAAEGLILQLPNTHDGRNSWLLNYGIREEAANFRKKRNLEFNHSTQAAVTTETEGNTL